MRAHNYAHAHPHDDAPYQLFCVAVLPLQGRGDLVTEHPGDQGLENEIDEESEDQDVDTRVERLNDDLVEDGMPEDEAARVAEQAAAIGDVRRGSRVRAPRNTQLPGEEDDDDEDC